jgi:hypothetical protein
LRIALPIFYSFEAVFDRFYSVGVREDRKM